MLDLRYRVQELRIQGFRLRARNPYMIQRPNGLGKIQFLNSNPAVQSFFFASAFNADVAQSRSGPRDRPAS